MVTLAKAGTTTTWSGDDPEQSLLRLGEDAGLEPLACRAGVCGICAIRLLAGDVGCLSAPSAAVEAAAVLLCVACP